MSISSTHGSVLVTDDDADLRRVLSRTLDALGFEVSESANGEQAVRTASVRPFDAILMDVNMPGMDGYEVLSAVRSEEIPVRVLLLTARQQESDVIRGFTLGADDYVVKPFSPMELVARMKRLLWR